MHVTIRLAPFKDGRKVRIAEVEFPSAESALAYARDEARKRAWVEMTATAGEIFVGQDREFTHGSLNVGA